MTWLVPSITATCISSFFLSLVYLYIYFTYRNRAIGVWTFSWFIYTSRFVFMMLWLKSGKINTYLVLNQSASLISGLLLLYGTYIWINRTYKQRWNFLGVAGLIWIIASPFLPLSFIVISLPTFIILGFYTISVGFLVYRHSPVMNKGTIIVSINFIIWGIHKFNYPILRPVEWFAPIGYIIGSVCSLIGALGLILMYFEKTRSDLENIQTLLTESIKQKEALISEVHHRVKNNLQIIAGLLNMQMGTTDDPRIQTILSDSESRIKAIAIVHERLYQTKDYSYVEIESYLSRLINDLAASLADKSITINKNITPHKVPVDKALNLGIIITELFTNAVKHAFPHRKNGEIEITCRPYRSGTEISLRDNGVGADPDHITKGLGYQLVELLTGQLNGRLETDSSSGFSVTVKTDVKPQAQSDTESSIDTRPVDILIVEDELITAKLLQKYLTSAGYTVGPLITSSEELIANVSIYNPRIILMDVVLAGKMDGIEAAHEIRKNRMSPVVIFCTANNDDAVLKRIEETGYNLLISKPFNRNDVIEFIKKNI